MYSVIDRKINSLDKPFTNSILWFLTMTVIASGSPAAESQETSSWPCYNSSETLCPHYSPVLRDVIDKTLIIRFQVFTQRLQTTKQFLVQNSKTGCKVSESWGKLGCYNSVVFQWEQCFTIAPRFENIFVSAQSAHTFLHIWEVFQVTD